MCDSLCEEGLSFYIQNHGVIRHLISHARIKREGGRGPDPTPTWKLTSAIGLLMNHKQKNVGPSLENYNF